MIDSYETMVEHIHGRGQARPIVFVHPGRREHCKYCESLSADDHTGLHGNYARLSMHSLIVSGWVDGMWQVTMRAPVQSNHLEHNKSIDQGEPVRNSSAAKCCL